MEADPAAPAIGKTSTHEKFNAADADVTIQSSDGVQFHLHRKYLEANTGAFPGPDDAGWIRSDDQGDIVHLTEPAEVLEILFEFVYPGQHPNLDGIEFEKLASIAEAAEKYEVFSALNVCEMHLQPFIAAHPIEILIHGVKYGYPQLIDGAALSLCRTPIPVDEILEKLPHRAQLPWVRYIESWGNIFNFIASWLEDITSPDTHAVEVQDKICIKCCSVLTQWNKDLEKLSSLEDLKSQLAQGLPENYRKVISGCRNCASSAEAPTYLIKICGVWIDSMPPFTDFLSKSAEEMRDAWNKIELKVLGVLGVLDLDACIVG